MSQSSCKATAYSAQAGPVEEHADAMLPYVYQQDRGRPPFNTSCLQPEVIAIDTYAHSLGASSLR